MELGFTLSSSDKEWQWEQEPEDEDEEDENEMTLELRQVGLYKEFSACRCCVYSCEIRSLCSTCMHRSQEEERALHFLCK